MKNKKFLTVLLLFFLSGGIILPQSGSELKISLKEVMSYMKQSQYQVVHASGRLL
jgi:hypothetical protein